MPKAGKPADTQHPPPPPPPPPGVSGGVGKRLRSKTQTLILPQTTPMDTGAVGPATGGGAAVPATPGRTLRSRNRVMTLTPTDAGHTIKGYDFKRYPTISRKAAAIRIGREATKEMLKAMKTYALPPGTKEAVQKVMATGTPQYTPEDFVGGQRAGFAIGKVSRNAGREGNAPDPLSGSIDTSIDDRSHGFASSSAARPSEANKRENIYPENSLVNQGYKQGFEKEVQEYARQNPSYKVYTAHHADYGNDPTATRPVAVTNYILVDRGNGEEVFVAIRMENPNVPLLT
ncbi:MAG: hypothetical protein U0271_47570 [Polyangiaceae bacterium]